MIQFALFPVEYINHYRVPSQFWIFFILMDLGWLQMMSPSPSQKGCTQLGKLLLNSALFGTHEKTKIRPVIKLEYVAIWRGSNISCLQLGVGRHWTASSGDQQKCRIIHINMAVSADSLPRIIFYVLSLSAGCWLLTAEYWRLLICHKPRPSDTLWHASPYCSDNHI